MKPIEDLQPGEFMIVSGVIYITLEVNVKSDNVMVAVTMAAYDNGFVDILPIKRGGYVETIEYKKLPHHALYL